MPHAIPSIALLMDAVGSLHILLALYFMNICSPVVRSLSLGIAMVAEC